MVRKEYKDNVMELPNEDQELIISTMPRYSQPINYHDQSLKIDKQELGGKGFSLSTMAEVGLPVPPGFILKTEVWKEFCAGGGILPSCIKEEIAAQVEILEEKSGCRLGDSERPLFVSVRSGAPISMPGVMVTILNVGINDQTVDILGREIGEQAAWEAYYELISSFASNICNVKIEEFSGVNNLPLNKVQEGIERLKQTLKNEGYFFPQNPHEQLLMAIETVFYSWNYPSARQYRQFHGINENMGTAAIVQQMVWGNSQREGSGSGVMLTRNIQTFKDKPTVAFIERAQGVAVVGENGLHKQRSIDDLPIPDNIKRQLYEIASLLEEHFGCPQDFEFTYDGEHLWALQTRDVPLQPGALFRFLQDSLKRGKITQEEARRLITTPQLGSLLTSPLDPEVASQKREAGDLLTMGTSISLGNASGVVVRSIEEAINVPQKRVILAIDNLTLAMIIGLMDKEKYPNVVGLVAGNGGIGSHIARVATGVGERMPILFGASLAGISSGEMVTVNGDTGEVFQGKIPRTKKNGVKILTPEEITIVEKWHKERLQNPWRFVTSEGGIEDYIVAGRKAYQEAQQKYDSSKAHNLALINTLVPYDIRINYEIVKPHEIELIKRLIGENLNQGYHVTLRSCYDPDRRGSAPWVFITDPSQIEDFFANPDYPWKYGGYPKWLEDADFTEVLIGANPKDKLSEDEKIRREHASWTLTCTEGGEIVLQIDPYTAQLRGHEEVGKEDIITCFVNIDPRDSKTVNNIRVKMGKNIQNEPIAHNLIEYTIRNVLELWWNKYDIPKRMAAVTEIFPPPSFAIPVLEGQTRAFSKWCKAYDIKIDVLE